MSGMYEVSDTDALFSQGGSIASLESEASAAGEAIVSELGSIQLGSDHGASGLMSSVRAFQTDVKTDSNATANAISNLGTNTSRGASTAVETNNEGTSAANSTTALARSLNTTAPTSQ